MGAGALRPLGHLPSLAHLPRMTDLTIGDAPAADSTAWGAPPWTDELPYRQRVNRWP